MSRRTRKPAAWGWTSYRRSGWARNDADGVRREYVAVFATSPAGPGMTWERCSVRFWARRPILALRAILTGRRHPTVFDGQVLN